MERFVNGKEFQRLFNEANPDSHIGYPKALQLLKKIKEMHEDCLLPSENVIPMTWVEEALGKGAYIRKKKKVLPSPPKEVAPHGTIDHKFN